MMMKKMCSVGMISMVLVIVGALNWLLVGIGMFSGSNLNLVHMILGSWMSVEALVYVLVGLAGIVTIGHMMGKCKKCCDAGACMGGKCKGGSCKGDNMPANGAKM